MFVMKCLNTDSNGELTIGGLNVCELADKYGTPLYIMDEDNIRENCRLYKNSIEKFYDNNGLILYASKALSCKYIYKIAAEEGLGVDVVSGGELYTALASGFPAEKIYFHGNNKTPDEIKYALDSNVGRIVVDNIDELNKINDFSKEKNIITKILFRIKPGVDAHTHDFIMTGQIDSKFGVALETGEAEDIIVYANKLDSVKVVGVHCHIGSQIFDIDPFVHTAEKMMNFIGDLKDKYDIEISELNLGGGYGIKYLESDDPVPYDSYIEKISSVVKNTAESRGVSVPKILMEPGRSLVAPAGITVYTVGSVKHIPNARTYVSVDGGMCDNPRYILYESKYEALLPKTPSAKKTQMVTIAGKCCESGDILAKDIMMPEIKSGDKLAVLATGAYNYSMSSNYNRIPRPPIVMVSNGASKVVVKRETYEDLIKNDL